MLFIYLNPTSYFSYLLEHECIYKTKQMLGQTLQRKKEINNTTIHAQNPSEVSVTFTAGGITKCQSLLIPPTLYFIHKNSVA